METQGGGYVVVYIRAKYFYREQSLSDGKTNRCRLRYGTLAQDS